MKLIRIAPENLLKLAYSSLTETGTIHTSFGLISLLVLCGRRHLGFEIAHTPCLSGQ